MEKPQLKLRLADRRGAVEKQQPKLRESSVETQQPKLRLAGPFCAFRPKIKIIEEQQPNPRKISVEKQPQGKIIEEQQQDKIGKWSQIEEEGGKIRTRSARGARSRSRGRIEEQQGKIVVSRWRHSTARHSRAGLAIEEQQSLRPGEAFFLVPPPPPRLPWELVNAAITRLNVRGRMSPDEYVRRFGVCTSDHPYGVTLWQGMAEMLVASPTVHYEAEKMARGWFHCPSPFSRLNAQRGRDEDDITGGTATQLTFTRSSAGPAGPLYTYGCGARRSSS